MIDALILDHPLDPGTFAVHPGHELFTSSSDGGKTWSPAVQVGGSAGTISDTEWWIDGNLSTDRAGNLYANWDIQSPSGDRDIGWLSYFTDRGRSWSAPIRVTPDQDNAVHIVESAGAGPGIGNIAWQSGNSPQMIDVQHVEHPGVSPDRPAAHTLDGPPCGRRFRGWPAHSPVGA